MQIAIAIYPGFTVLDAIGPYQVFSFWPGAEVAWCAERRGAIEDDRKMVQLVVEHTFDEVTAPDIIVIPGGPPTRRLANDRHPIVEWIEATHPHTDYTASVCSGSLLLGAAGLLNGVRATTHWAFYEALAGFGAEPVDERVVESGKIFTGAGVSAGIDLALTIVERVDGIELAQAIQLGIEYDPEPPVDAGRPSKAPPAIVDLVRSVVHAADAEAMSAP